MPSFGERRRGCRFRCAGREARSPARSSRRLVDNLPRAGLRCVQSSASARGQAREPPPKPERVRGEGACLAPAARGHPPQAPPSPKQGPHGLPRSEGVTRSPPSQAQGHTPRHPPASHRGCSTSAPRPPTQRGASRGPPHAKGPGTVSTSTGSPRASPPPNQRRPPPQPAQRPATDPARNTRHDLHPMQHPSYQQEASAHQPLPGPWRC